MDIRETSMNIFEVAEDMRLISVWYGARVWYEDPNWVLELEIPDNGEEVDLLIDELEMLGNSATYQLLDMGYEICESETWQEDLVTYLYVQPKERRAL